MAIHLSKFNPLDHPIFLAEPNRLDAISAWIEHVPFALLVIDLVRPNVLVELGTYTGVSYCAFCQAVRQLALETRCYAVDTWQGDPHSGYYGAQVLDELRAYHDPLYGDFSRLLQGTFDETARRFADGSIDLLHIDGLHTYQAVKHDFETWLPKLSRDGVILFHDIHVHEREFGVWQLWEELKAKYPSFEFMHGHGLGLLAVGIGRPPALDMLLGSTEDAPPIRDLFHHLGARLGMRFEIERLHARLEDNERTEQALRGTMAEQDALIQALTSRVKELEGQLADIKRSLCWRTIVALRRILERVRGSWLGRLWRFARSRID